MPRVTFVKKARKAHPAGGIKKGESYYWWAFMQGGRGGPKHYSKTPPKASQLTQSEFLGAFYDIEEEIGALSADSGLGDATAEIAQRLHELADEQESKKSNMPDGLQEGDTGQMLEQRTERCNEIADELEGLTFDYDGDKEDKEDAEDADETEDDYWQRKLEEVQGVDLSVD